jgi:diguanylate cyclase (GGDEF)-like protein/PAS domain S-box-containing protein
LIPTLLSAFSSRSPPLVEELFQKLDGESVSALSPEVQNGLRLAMLAHFDAFMCALAQESETDGAVELAGVLTDPLALVNTLCGRHESGWIETLAALERMWFQLRRGFRQAISEQLGDDEGHSLAIFDQIFGQTELGFVETWCGTMPDSMLEMVLSLPAAETGQWSWRESLFERLSIPVVKRGSPSDVPSWNPAFMAADAAWIGAPDGTGGSLLALVVAAMNEVCSADGLPGMDVTIRLLDPASSTERLVLGTSWSADGHVEAQVGVLQKAPGQRTQCVDDDLDQAVYETVFDAAGAAVVLLDTNLRVVRFNEIFRQISCFASGEIRGQHFPSLVHPSERDLLLRRLLDLTEQQPTSARFEMRILRADGLVAWVSMAVSRVHLFDRRPVYALYMLDSNDLHLARERLQQRAFHDTLTALPNRSLFEERLTHAIERTRRWDSLQFAVLFMDLDRFKQVNDSFGHRVGDVLLVQAAARLKRCVRPGDTVARFGGDEFAVLLERVSDGAQVRRIAKRILEAFREPFDLKGTSAQVTISVGITRGDSSVTHPAAMLDRADIALYQAKRAGRACIVDYSEVQVNTVDGSPEIEAEFRKALNSGGIEVHYLPIVAPGKGKVVGLEALARWSHPVRGPISSAELMPWAEKWGLIRQINELVLQRCCGHIQSWPQGTVIPSCAADGEGPNPGRGGVFIYLNLSDRQSNRSDLPEALGRIIEEQGVPASTFAVQIRELDFVEDPIATGRFVSRLRELGLATTLKHFQGRLPFAFLLDNDFSLVKVDRALNPPTPAPGSRKDLLRTILHLSSELDTPFVVEGVESAEQYQRLDSVGARYAQGFWFTRPLLPSQVPDFVAAQHDW